MDVIDHLSSALDVYADPANWVSDDSGKFRVFTRRGGDGWSIAREALGMDKVDRMEMLVSRIVGMLERQEIAHGEAVKEITKIVDDAIRPF